MSKLDPIKHIDSDTPYQGQGPGLVETGIRIESTNPDKTGQNSWIQWNGNAYFGTDTKTIYSDRALEIDFLNSTSAFGIDIKDYPSFRNSFEVLVEVFAADDSTLLHSSNITLDPPVDIGVFFGYQHGAGIGSVIFHTSLGNTNLSPQIDNLAFSSAPVPEPTTTALALAATLCFIGRRRAR